MPDTNTHPEQESLRAKLEALEYEGEDVFEDVRVIDMVMHLIEQDCEQAAREVEADMSVYMEPGRYQDYKNHRDATFQNDQRVNGEVL